MAQRRGFGAPGLGGPGQSPPPALGLSPVAVRGRPVPSSSSLLPPASLQQAILPPPRPPTNPTQRLPSPLRDRAQRLTSPLRDRALAALARMPRANLVRL